MHQLSRYNYIKMQPNIERNDHFPLGNVIIFHIIPIACKLNVREFVFDIWKSSKKNKSYFYYSSHSCRLKYDVIMIPLPIWNNWSQMSTIMQQLCNYFIVKYFLTNYVRCLKGNVVFKITAMKVLCCCTVWILSLYTCCFTNVYRRLGDTEA